MPESNSVPGYGIYRIALVDLVNPACGKHELSRKDDNALTASELSSLSDSPVNKWIVYPVSASEQGIGDFRISSIDGKHVLSWKEEDLSLVPSGSSRTTWNIEAAKGKNGDEIWHYLKISPNDKPGYYIKVNDTTGPLTKILTKEDEAPCSGWKFEKISDEVSEHLSWSALSAADGESFQQKFFNLTLKEAAWEEYDIIIVGSGIGGGILANDLYDTNSRLGKNAKRILLLERGGLVFHSHCLNTARPAGLANDRGQQNDTFFKQFKRQYLFEPKLEKEDAEIPGDPKRDPKQQDPWSGGAMYCLGGRSAAWGLFAPRVHDSVLRDKYHSQVYQDLREQYYDKAERLMLVSLPTTRRAHQHVMDRLTSKCQEVEPSVQWQWGRIASEFKDDRNFDFAEGAYSTIDKILEIAMSRPKTDVQSRSGDDVFTEHKYFKTVLNADVRSLNFDTNGAVTGVNVKAANGENTTINVRNPGKGVENGKVVLCAGSVHSPAILLRSDHTKAKIQDEKYNALHLTDHNILFFQASFRYTNPALREELGAMKLQTYAKIDNQIVLFNMSIDASSFLPRGKSPDPKLPKFIFVIMLQDELVKDNSIVLENDEPKIRLNRRNMPLSEEKMRKFILAAMKALVGSAGLEFVDFEDLKADSKFNDVNDKKFLKKIDIGYLPLGGVAHELGTLPMVSKLESDAFCLDSNLRVRPEICDGVYVCDLSCFPHSPAANPTLTLAALAIRLSRHLNERLRVKVQDNTRVYTVNQTSAKVRVFLSYQKPRGKSGNVEEAVVLAPGQEYSWQREANVPQGLFIYRLDMSSQEEKFLDRPVVLVAHPGKVTPILYD
ncbi:hypothetical protein RhiTH_007250 [Rhizoctonia solani]